MSTTVLKGEKKPSARPAETNAADVARRLLGALGGAPMSHLTGPPQRSFGEETPPNGDDIESIESLEPLGDDEEYHVVMPAEQHLRRRPRQQPQQQQQLHSGSQRGQEQSQHQQQEQQKQQQQQPVHEGHQEHHFYDGPEVQQGGTAGRGHTSGLHLDFKQLALVLGVILILLLFPLAAMVTFGPSNRDPVQKDSMASVILDLQSTVSVVLQDVAEIRQQLRALAAAHNSTELQVRSRVDQLQGVFKGHETMLQGKMTALLQGRTPEAYAASQAELRASVAALTLELRRMQQERAAAQSHAVPASTPPPPKAADPQSPADSPPPCNIQHLEKTHGRVAPAKVVSHSPLLGEYSPQMTFYRALSKILKGRQGYVNPRARQLAIGADAPSGLFASALGLGLGQQPSACVPFYGPPCSLDIALMNASHGSPPLSLVNVTAVTLISAPNPDSQQIQRFRVWYSEVKTQAASPAQPKATGQAASSEPAEPAAARWAVAGDFEFERPSVSNDHVSTGVSPRYCRTFTFPKAVQVVAGSGGFVLEVLPHAGASTEAAQSTDSAAHVTKANAGSVCMPTVILHTVERSM